MTSSAKTMMSANNMESHNLTGQASRVTRHAIEPGARVGVLGGGQLGAFFAMAARRLGYGVAVWDPDPDAPGLPLADLPIAAPFADPAALGTFAEAVAAVTVEWENVPASLVAALERQCPARPSGTVLRTLQDRLEQKTFLAARGFPVAPFRPIESPDDLKGPDPFGFPCLCKTATAGYDGKGQWRLSGFRDLEAMQDRVRQGRRAGRRWILEEWVPFRKELSVLVGRGADGDRRVYPPVENLHEGGILRATRAPALLEPGLADQGRALAGSVIEALEGVGLFCVELFLLADDRLLINEIAPRPHNSGHYTLDACPVSQFEQQVRALCGLPLGEVRLLCPAAMLNILGGEVDRLASGEGLLALMRTPGAKLHLYGKRVARPGRKMGHVTLLAEDPEEAWRGLTRLWRALSPDRELPSVPTP